MAIEFQCERCNAKLRVPDSVAGKMARCKCGHVQQVVIVAEAVNSQTNIPVAELKEDKLDATLILNPDKTSKLKAVTGAPGEKLAKISRPQAPPPPAKKQDNKETLPKSERTPDEKVQPLKRLGQYDILQELGRGGMGVVYKARDHRLNRTVALKVLLAGEDASREQLLQFQREAEAVAKLSHPNIVQVYDVGEDGNRHYFAMDFIEGDSLDSLLKAGRMKERRVAEIIMKTAAALDHCHEKAIFHRDVKPANIIIDKRGEPKIMDFGLAKGNEVKNTKLTRTGMIIGTPSYMSPEQVASRKDIDGRADIWALGVMLYEMLCGETPFRGKTTMEIITKVATVDPIPIGKRVKIPLDLNTIVMKCLEKNRADRYAKAGELSDDLKRYLDSDPIHAVPPGFSLRVFRKIQKHKIWAVAVALILTMGTSSWYFVEHYSEIIRKQTIESRAENLRRINDLAGFLGANYSAPYDFDKKFALIVADKSVPDLLGELLESGTEPQKYLALMYWHDKRDAAKNKAITKCLLDSKNSTGFTAAAALLIRNDEFGFQLLADMAKQNPQNDAANKLLLETYKDLVAKSKEPENAFSTLIATFANSDESRGKLFDNFISYKQKGLPPDALGLLPKIIKTDKSPAVRAKAITVLVNTLEKSQPSEELLATLISVAENDTDKEPRTAAMSALGTLMPRFPEKIGPVIGKNLKLDTDRETRAIAVTFFLTKDNIVKVPTEALPAFFLTLKEQDDARNKAFDALRQMSWAGKIPDAFFPFFNAMLLEEEDKECRALLYNIYSNLIDNKNLPPDSAVKLVEYLKTAKEVSFRAKTANFVSRLAEQGRAECLSACLDALNSDAAPEVRREISKNFIAGAAGLNLDPKILSALIKLFSSDKDEQVLLNLAEFFQKMYVRKDFPKDAIAPLFELLKTHPNIALRKNLVKGMSSLVPVEVLTFEHFSMIANLQKENADPEVKQGLQATLSAYGNVPGQSSLKFLEMAKNEKDEQVLQTLSQILQGQCNRPGFPKEGTAPVFEMIKTHPSVNVRRNLINCLGGLIRTGVVTSEHFSTLLGIAKENTDAGVKQTIMQTLVAFGNPPVPVDNKFIDMLKIEKDEQVLQTLSQILQGQCNRPGFPKEVAAPVLEMIKTHPSVNVRRNLINCLGGLIRTGVITSEHFSTLLGIAKENTDAGVKQTIMQTLVAFGNPPAPVDNKFIDMLKIEKDEQTLSVLAQIVRAQVARRDFPKDKRPAIFDMMSNHSNQNVRSLLIQYIPQMVQQGAVTMENFPVLLKLMKETNDANNKRCIAQSFNALTRQNLGVEPGPWEKWWEQNKAAFAPKPVVTPTPRLTPVKPVPRPTPPPRVPRKR